MSISPEIKLFDISKLKHTAKKIAIKEHREFLLALFDRCSSGFVDTRSEYKKRRREYRVKLTPPYIVEQSQKTGNRYFEDGQKLPF